MSDETAHGGASMGMNGGGSPGAAIRVVLVDDHDLFRRGLRELLEAQDIAVVGEASNGPRGVKLAAELAPDVVIMDLSMPGMSGVEATRLVRAQARAPVLVLTVSDDEASTMDALIAGASGYVLKDAPIHEIVGGVRAAARGESALSPPVAAQLLLALRSGGARQVEPGARHDLTDRELEVLNLIAEGMTNAEIADRLSISPVTAKNHTASILLKLGVDNRVQAAVYAVRKDLA
jgi:DNA-binding NarL/FixJ family response regulator